VEKVNEAANAAEVSNEAKAQAIETTTEAVEANAETKESANERLLRESKEWKKKAQEYQKMLKDREEATLKEQNNYKKLYETKTKELETLASKLLNDKKQMALSNAAQKWKLKSMDDVTLGNKELLQYDSESDQYQGVEAFFEDLKSKKPYLFEQNEPTKALPSRPGGQIKDVPIEQLPLNEREAVLKQKLAAMFAKK
jgi:hypothetical protein